MPVTMPGERDRQHRDEAHRVAAEEAVPGERERGERAEHQRDRRRQQCGLQRIAAALRVDRTRDRRARHHSSVKPWGGHANRFALLNDSRAM